MAIQTVYFRQKLEGAGWCCAIDRSLWGAGLKQPGTVRFL
jgi:hypothetical protein